ncbi:MAG: SufD family Fe-S cluster assembly protein [Infirmifilum sp.]
MSLKELKAIPYQPVADSPAVRYYTDWNAFEPYLENPAPPVQLGWDDDALRLLNLKPDLILKPTPLKDKPELPEASSKRVLAFHLNTLNSQVNVFLRDTSYTILVPKPREGVLATHLSVRATGNSTLNVLLLSPADAEGLNTLSIDVEVDTASTLRLNYIIRDSYRAPSAIFQRTRLDKDSRLETFLIGSRGRMTHMEMNQLLEGEASEAETVALLAAGKFSRITLETSAETRAPRTEISIRGLGFANEGFIAHKGFARARRGAMESRLEVRSRLIPLSPTSRVYAAPVLEIESDEPSYAAHSVAMGPLDPEHIFYIESRGFNEAEAVRLLVKSMYASLISRMRGSSLYQHALRLLLEELGL